MRRCHLTLPMMRIIQGDQKNGREGMRGEGDSEVRSSDDEREKCECET